MQAVIYQHYGPPEVLQLTEIETPVPQEHELLIRVAATTVTATDCLMRQGKPTWSRIILGFRKPRKQILGIEFAGEIAGVGQAVTRFKPGQQVCGATMVHLSACAEYLCLPESAALVIKPATLTDVEAAAFPDGALTALTFLRDIGKLQSGQCVLIYGASGSIGSFAVQLASYFGAQVTAVCSSANLAMVQSLGAARVIDYTREDFRQSGERYDIVFDAVGKTSFAHCKGIIKPGGVFLGCSMERFLWPLLPQMLLTFVAGRRKVKTGASKASAERLAFLAGLAEAGKLRPIIDRCYRLEQIVAAHRYVDSGHKRGNVVIMVRPTS